MKNVCFVVLLLTLILFSTTCVAASFPSPVPRTGQIKCYDGSGNEIACSGTGQDGDYLSGLEWPSPRFTDNGDGTVTDNLTGLIWLKDGFCNDAMLNWSNALAFANSLADGQCGLSDGSQAGDWHLPQIKQVLSLIDHDNTNPALPAGHPFRIETPLYPVSPFYWTSTTYMDGIDPNSPKQAMTVDFITGATYFHLKTAAYYVMPVKKAVASASAPVAKTGQTKCYDVDGNEINCAGTGQDGEIQAGVSWPAPRFTDNGDGTVTDNLTGLVWLKNARCWEKKYWSSAPGLVRNLASGECGLTDGSQAGDWHLANILELHSLLDYQNSGPALPSGHPFENVVQEAVHSYYWSSTNYPADAKNMHVVDYKKGYEYYRLKADSWWIWPVRYPAKKSEMGPSINFLLFD